MRVVVIGCGGIGGQLLPILSRFLYALRDACHLVCVDGDKYELKNAARMVFAGRLENKAIVMADDLARTFGAVLTIEPVPEFVELENIGEIIESGDVVFLAVDNHKSRKLVADHVAQLDDITLISGGNDGIENGQDGCYGSVQIFRRVAGRSLTSRLDAFHPEIAEPADRLPTEIAANCDVQAATSAPQLLFTNVFVSAVMLNAFYGLLHDKVAYEEVYLDIGRNRVQPVVRELEA